MGLLGFLVKNTQNSSFILKNQCNATINGKLKITLIMKSLKTMLETAIAKIAIHRHKKLLTQLKRQSYERFQLLEFDGDVHLAYNGVPITSVGNLKTDVVKTLNKSRNTYVRFTLAEMGIEDEPKGFTIE